MEEKKRERKEHVYKRQFSRLSLTFSAFSWPRGDFYPLVAIVAWSPDWHFALPPAGGDREWRPPSSGKPVPTGPRPTPDTLGPLGTSLPLKWPSESGPGNTYLRAWETEAESKVGLSQEVAGGSRDPQRTFLRPLQQKAGNAKWIGPSTSPAWN